MEYVSEVLDEGKVWPMSIKFSTTMALKLRALRSYIVGEATRWSRERRQTYIDQSVQGTRNWGVIHQEPEV